MDYTNASLQLTGRCKERRKLANNTYLIRRGPKEIAVRLHSTDILTFYADRRIEVNDGGWPTVTTKDRMNRYLPREWQVWTESGNMCIGAFKREESYHFDHFCMILPDGTVEGAEPIEKLRERIRQERNEAARPRRKLRYWLNKAREGKPFRGTVADVMAEENVSIRLVKIRCYGTERFFLDANPLTIDEQAGYQLLDLPVEETGWARTRLRALKMTCPSTGAVYINPVPPSIETVPAGLDWMFQTENYLGSVTQQT